MPGRCMALDLRKCWERPATAATLGFTLIASGDRLDIRRRALTWAAALPAVAAGVAVAIWL